MALDVASSAADLLAQFGTDADEEARRQLDAACSDDRGRDAQHWISVVFFLARNRPVMTVSA
jgi:hypothetical protein